MTTSHEMTVLKCSGKDCQAYITVNEPTTSSTTYTCKDHTHQAKKPDVHFQNSQFDEDLNNWMTSCLLSPRPKEATNDHQS